MNIYIYIEPYTPDITYIVNIYSEPYTPDITTQEYTRTKKGGSNRYKQNKTVSRSKQQKHLTYRHAHTYTYLDAHICTEIYVDACTYIYR